MRPGILPYSKNRLKVTTLNFQDFHYRPPSLTRNKWSCFRPTGYIIVKTAKCRSDVHIPTRAGTATSCRTHHTPAAPHCGTAPHDAAAGPRTGLWLLASGYWPLVTGYWLLILDTDTGYWILILDTGYWGLETGDWSLLQGPAARAMRSRQQC